MNTPVSFEIAKLLKEKGFNELCNHLYFDKELKEVTIQKVSYDDTLSSRYYIAPTIAEVVMWLYEKHGIWIEVSYMDDVLSFGFNICTLETNTVEDEQWKFTSPTEAYSQAIEYTLKNLI